MVSTRGGARTRAEDPKASMLSQKPRRAAAKPAQAKTTRSKKTAPEPRSEDTEDELQDQHEEEAPAPAKRLTRKDAALVAAKEEPAKTMTRRAARAVKKDEPTSKPAPAPKRTAKDETPTAMRATNLKSSTADDKPKLAPPTSARATRATRATAGKEKKAPLSPKKITQVSTRVARGARGGPTKASVAKQAATKAPTQSRPAMRRHISDENAVPNASDTIDDEIMVGPVSTGPGTKAKSARKTAVELPEDEAPAFTRRHAPSQATNHERDMSEDEIQHDQMTDEQSYSDSEDDAASGDELCGPKTPMKRSSTKHAAAQKSKETTSERQVVINTKRCTPHTQNIRREPFLLLSDSVPAPMTVARPPSFPRLRPSVQRPEEQATGTQEYADVSDEVVDHPDVGMESDEASLAFVEPFIGEIDCAEDTMFDMHDDNVTEVGLDAAIERDVSSIADVGVSLSSGNLDETIVEDLEDNNESDVSTSSSIAHGSILVAEDGGHDIERPLTQTGSDERASDDQFARSVEPETMVWENIRQDVTIPFNFDSDMTAGTLPQIEHNERLSLVTGIANDEIFIAEGTSMQQTKNATNDRLSIGSRRISLDTENTVNISEFIDVDSLSRSSTMLRLEAEQHLMQAVDGADIDAHAANEKPQQVSTVVDAEASRLNSSPVLEAESAAELDLCRADRESRGRSLPRYAMSTIASRSKSLPASPSRTPLKDNRRPNTADGASMPRLAQPFRPLWLLSPTKRMTPVRKRSSTDHRLTSTVKRGRSRTSAVRTPYAKTPGTSVPETSRLFKQQLTPISRPLFARTPGTSIPNKETPPRTSWAQALHARGGHEGYEQLSDTSTITPRPVMRERFPGLPSKETYEELTVTPVAEPRETENTPAARNSLKKERFPGLPSRETYAELDSNPGVDNVESVPATPRPIQDERYPGLPYRRTYEEHANTTMPASRFQAPPRLSVAKRPATVQKPTSLRKIALKASTPRRSQTPLRKSAETPGQEPMTPHPAAPLRGIVALAEVYTSDGLCATPAFTVLLRRLGAKTTKTFSERITHVVFKEGSPQLLQRLRVHNKQVADTGIGNEIYCVNSRWVTDCDTEGKRVDEANELYTVDMDELPRSAKRRRKSMEPMSLINIGGNVVRDRDRKSSLGRSSLGRMKSNSPREQDPSTPKALSITDKENSGEEASPVTPAYLAAPESLVMQTEAPKRIKKLTFGDERSKNRRQTFFPGAF